MTPQEFAAKAGQVLEGWMIGFIEAQLLHQPARNLRNFAAVRQARPVVIPFGR